MPNIKLSESMIDSDFGANYFYARDLKKFAQSIGISVGTFRKYELEELIKEYLVTKVVPSKKPTLPRKAGGNRDVLGSSVMVENNVGDRQTKDLRMNNFISDYLTNESTSGMKRADAMDAWNRTRDAGGPKTYAAYKKLKSS